MVIKRNEIYVTNKKVNDNHYGNVERSFSAATPVIHAIY